MEQRSMNQVNDKNLQQLAVPTVTLKAHQVQLKHALLAASRPTKNNYKQRWSNLMSKPKFIVSGAGMAFAVLAILAVSTFTNFGSVSAAELTQHGLNTLSHMSPGDIRALDMRINSDPTAELQAAKQAKDLKVYTYDELQKQDPQSPKLVSQPGKAGALDDAPTHNDPKSLKYLRFTSKDGATHTIGVNKDGLPIMVMVSRNNQNGSSEGSVMVQDSAGESGTATSGSGTPEGMVSCGSGSDGKTTCTNSDGSSAPTPNCQKTSDGGTMCSSSASTTKQ
jgi:hypothetical protein